MIENYKISSETKEGDKCPECGGDWDGGDILDDLIKHKNEGHETFVDKSHEELIEYASSYGWTLETPRRWGRIIGMELSYDDPRHYDGVSFWMCTDCGIAWDRFSGDRTEEFLDYHSEILKREGEIKEEKEKQDRDVNINK